MSDLLIVDALLNACRDTWPSQATRSNRRQILIDIAAQAYRQGLEPDDFRSLTTTQATEVLTTIALTIDISTSTEKATLPESWDLIVWLAVDRCWLADYTG